jgi:hypothetical protein
MLFIAIGLILGVAVTAGPLAFLRAPIGAITDALMAYGAAAAERILVEIASVPETGPVVGLLSPLVAILLPGCITLLLVAAIRASSALRRFLSALAVCVAALSFFFLPFSEAILILVVALVLSTLTGLLTGAVVQLPLTVVATSFAVSTSTALLGRTDARFATAVEEFSAAVGAGDPSMWRVALVATALFPFAAALWMLVKD